MSKLGHIRDQPDRKDATTAIGIDRYHQWDVRCTVDESNVTESNFSEYIRSLEWLWIPDDQTKGRSVVTSEINEIGAQWGRNFVVTGATDRSFYLKCCRHGIGVTRVAADKQVRETSTNKINCEFHFLFGHSMQYYKVDNCYHRRRVWRVTSCKNHDADANHSHGHHGLCKPNMMMRKGGIVFMHQLTKPMIDAINLMASGNSIRPCDIRTTLQEQFGVSFIDFTLIQNVMNIGKARGPKVAEIDNLLSYFQMNSDEILFQCQWQKAKLDTETVLEIRNVFWATKQMMRLFREYGQLLIVDATYRSNNFNMKLLLFTIRAGNGRFTIVAAALVQHESTEDLRWAFLQLMKFADMNVGVLSSDATHIMPDQANQSPSFTQSTSSSNQSNDSTINLERQHPCVVETIITDGAPAYPSLIKEVYPGVVHQLCYWHQQKLMRAFCLKWADDPTSAMRDLMDILREPDEKLAIQWWNEMVDEHFNEPLQERPVPTVKETIKQQTDREDMNKKRSNARALLKEWREMAPKYWQCYTKHYRNLGSLSSQGGEIMNNAVKRRRHVTLSQLIKMTNRVASNHMFDQLRSFNDASRIPLSNNIGMWTDVLRSSLSTYAAKALTEQLKAAIKNRWSVDKNGTMKTTNREVIVSLSEQSCSCGYVKQHGLMCRHLIALQINSEPTIIGDDGKIAAPSNEMMKRLATVCMESAHRRWTHDAVLRVTEDDGTAHSDVNEISADPFGNEHLDVVVNRPPTHVPTSEVMRQLEIEDLIGRLQRFGKKDRLASEVAIIVLERAVNEMEQMYSEKRTSSQEISADSQQQQLAPKQLTVVSTLADSHHSLTNVSSPQLTDADASTKRADPIHRRVARKLVKKPVNTPKSKSERVAIKQAHQESRKREIREFAEDAESPSSFDHDEAADAAKRRKTSASKSSDLATNASVNTAANEAPPTAVSLIEKLAVDDRTTNARMNLIPATITPINNHAAKSQSQRVCSACGATDHIFSSNRTCKKPEKPQA